MASTPSHTSATIAKPDAPRGAALICVINNPLQPKDNLERHEVPEGSTINEWLSRRFPESHNFPAPTFCVKDNAPNLRARWDDPLRHNDLIVFVPAPGGWAEVIWYLVILIVSVTVSLLLSPSQSTAADTNIGETPQADPVYTLRGQRNEKKLSTPIECAFGRYRTWPSYGASPYSVFQDNDSYLFQLFCLGQGKHEIHQIYIEDTPLEEFQNIEYEIVEPGEAVTLFPDNIFTSTEVGGIELFGPNEAAYTDWTPAYTACPPLQQTSKIEVDLAFPRGIYYQSGPSLINRTATAEFQYREIDDAGTAVGNWETGALFTKTLKTITQQRYTITITVPLGRYEVRAVRTNNAELNHAGSSQMMWRGLRSYLPSVLVYPGVTMLAMKAKATNNLNDTASTRVNLVATRKLRVWDANTEVWLEDIATRSPIWAFCEIFTAEYGGRLPDEFLDLVSLAELAEELDAEGVAFDWVFDRDTTCWDAASTIGKICRARPILSGSKITMVRERPQVLPVAMFSPENMIRDSFNYELKLRPVESHDCIEAEYINAETWLPETVLCVAPGDEGTRPKVVKFPGCTDRTRAYRLGMYMRLCEIKLRTNINFTTGLEGLLPAYGDLVAITHPLPRWGAGGYVKAINGNLVTLSRPVTFGSGAHYLLLRRKNGAVFGPALCTATADAAVVEVSDTITPAHFLTSQQNGDPATFMFGNAAQPYAKLATISELQPSGDENVAVKCLIYDAAVFDYDEATAPALTPGYYVPAPETVPVIKNLIVRAHPTSTTLVVVSWQGIAGITKYTVETSNDGETYNVQAEPTVPYYVLTVAEQELWVRVSATAVGTGVAAEWHGNVGIALDPPDNVTGLALAAWTGTVLSATWTPVTTGADIDGYIVRWFTRANGGSYKLARTVFTTDVAAEYTLADAIEDGAANREARVLVTASNIVAESATAAEDTETNPAPGMPTSLTHAHLGVVGGFRRFRLSWTGSGDGDLGKFRVWASGTSGFPITDQYIVYEGTDPFYILEVPATPNPPYAPNSPARYWRVAELDAWGNEYTESAQRGINPVNDEYI